MPKKIESPQLIPVFEDDIRKHHTQNAERYLEIVKFWEVSCIIAKVSDLNWTREMRTYYNPLYESFSQLFKQWLYSLPAPSDFTERWSLYEANFENRLFCLRPPNARASPPLCTLHDVFRQYLFAVPSLLPQASETAMAYVHRWADPFLLTTTG